MESLKISRECLESNIVPSKTGPLFCCGPSHFHFFWLRDFSFSVPGLLLIGKADVVKRHLTMSLDHIRADGLMPRSFDVINPKLRVVMGVVGIHASKFWPYTKKDLKPEFTGEHNTPAADSNVLVLEACLMYTAATGDTYFLKERQKEMKQAFDGILRLRNGDFLEQPAFSDWQDSAKREGHTFYLNLLFYRLVLGLKKAGVDWIQSFDSDELLKKLWEKFYSKEDGLFLSQLPGFKQFSLETQLWAIEGDFFKKYISREELWKNLKASPLWKPMAALPVWPQYARDEISWTTKFVGLRHYHDNFHWSWLMGESLKVSTIMGDKTEADRLFTEIERLTHKYKTVHEIYEVKSGELIPVMRPLYHSEYAFSWGSAKLIEGLVAYQKAQLS